MIKKIIALLSICLLNTHLAAADGDLDTTTFGVPNGFVDTAAGALATDTAVQTDGKIVVIGFGPGFSGASIVRYNTDGSLDTSFNVTGIGEAPTGELYSLLIQPDGKIIVGGQESTFTNFQLIRYNTDGTIDTSFGTSGYGIGPSGSAQAIVLLTDGTIIATGDDNSGNLRTVQFAADGNSFTTFTASSAGFGTDVVVQTDGKIIVGYTVFPASFKLLRYNTNGTIDASYGIAGVATGPAGNIQGLVIQPDDYVIAGGFSDPLGNNVIARFDTTGNLDTANFNAPNGYTVGPAGIPRDIVLQADGYSVLIGSDSANTNFELVRYTGTGVLDSANFGTGGIATGPLGIALGGALQQDGKIIAVGRPTSLGNFRVARYENSPVLTTTQILVPTNGTTLPAGTIVFSGTAQNPSNVYLFVNGVLTGSTITDAGGADTWTLSIPFATAGAYAIDVVSIYHDGNVNIASTPITITIQSPVPPITPPINPTGTMVCNKFLNTKECVLTITWEPSTAPDVVTYRIFRDGVQLADIPATEPHTYTICAATSFCTECCTLSDFKNLTIAAVNADGDVSTVVPINTPCSPQPTLI